VTPLIIIGDVHGDIDALRRALAHAQETSRKTIFLGDYVNGGTRSAEVLEELASLKTIDPSRWLFLAGNHDLALLDFLNDGDFSAFARLGGVQTIASYVTGMHANVHKVFSSAMPAHHKSFLQSLSACYEEDDLLISHTGFCPERPADRSLDALARVGDKRIFSSPTPRNLVVCGHYQQWDHKPFISEHLICIDTGCGVSDGPLTTLFLPERTLVSF